MRLPVRHIPRTLVDRNTELRAVSGLPMSHSSGTTHLPTEIMSSKTQATLHFLSFHNTNISLQFYQKQLIA